MYTYILKVQDDCIKDKGSVTDDALQSLIAVGVHDLQRDVDIDIDIYIFFFHFSLQTAGMWL